MKIILKQMQGLGDLLVLSSAIKNLHMSYPNIFETYVYSNYPEIFYYNPYILIFKLNEAMLTVDLSYKDKCEDLKISGKHFSECFIKILNEKLKLKIKTFTNYPHVYLNEQERDKEYITNKFGLKEKNYWLLNAGVKNDCPIKGYLPKNYQNLVNLLYYNSDFDNLLIQVGDSNHVHPELKGVKNLVGRTSLRDIISLAYHSNGVITGISFLMHLAAAFKKPLITLGGLREQPIWECYNYDKHIYLFKNCDDKYCWVNFKKDCKNICNNEYPECLNIPPEIIEEEIIKLCN